MNVLQMMGLALLSALILIERFLYPLPDSLAIALASAALMLLAAGMLWQGRNARKKREAGSK
ncbi:MAG: hypothetical protein IJQ36_06025 [Oscillospiraceae bacterium]|nr:hypothetical protein [Oscillospiraceae bacterium]